MRGLALVVLLTFISGASFAKGMSAHDDQAQTPSDSGALTAQVPGSEDEAYLRQITDAVTNSGYKDPDVIPMFVVSATDANGKRVLLLVDPETMQAIEVRDDPDVAASAHK
jgi:hypothetical protein